VEPFNQRQGFLVSAILHLMILMSLVSRVTAPKPAALQDAEKVPPASSRVYLPPPAVLRQLLPPPPQPRRAPTPPPVAPAPQQAQKDRISVGAPSTQRAKGPLVLRREDDLTKTAKGQPDAVPTPPPATPPPAEPERTASAAGGAAPEAPGAPGLRLPPGVGGERQGAEGSRARPGQTGPSITSSLRNFEQRLQTTGPMGLPTGTGQQMGPLFFDPQGADFTAWINHFKNEVYRNWIVPQPVLLGFRGHVDLEFSVERDGTLTGLRLLKSSGTRALDRAAQNALLGSRLLPLPPDYRPPRITMQVTFFYNEGPQGS
jgi:protein TonB